VAEPASPIPASVRQAAAMDVHGERLCRLPQTESDNEKRSFMRRFIMTGAPGAGKTSILRALNNLGYAVVEEAATDAIAAHHAQGNRCPVLGLSRGRSRAPAGCTSQRDLSAHRPVR
jgi:hypothetical protein